MPIPEPKPGWSRRRFLQAAAVMAGGGVGLASSRRPALAGRAGCGEPRIVVVGAGLAGLNAARHLKRRNLFAAVYEAAPRLGGRVLSLSSAIAPGQIADIGGSFINSDHEDMLEIAALFNEDLFDRLRDEQEQPFPPIPARAFNFEGALLAEAEVAEALSPLAEQIAFDAALLDEDFAHFAPQFDALSVSHYLDRNKHKIPKKFIRNLIEAAIRSEYGVEAKDSSALQLLFILPTVDGNAVEVVGTSDEAFVVKAGTGALIDGFAGALNGQIHLGQRLVRLDAVGDAYRLTFEAEDDDEREGTIVDADFVVLALPFPAVRRVKLELELPKGLEKFIDQADLGRNEKLIASFSQRLWRDQRVFYTELASDDKFSFVWEETQRQPEFGSSALTFFTGGSDASEIAGKDPQKIGEKFVDRLDRVIGGLSAAATGDYLVTRWKKNDDLKGSYSSYRPGELTRFAPYFWIEGETADDSQEVAVGNLLFAGEQLSDAFYGFMNGAAQTGRLAAEAIVRRLA